MSMQQICHMSVAPASALWPAAARKPLSFMRSRPLLWIVAALAIAGAVVLLTAVFAVPADLVETVVD